LASDFVATAEENNFAAARWGYSWGMSHGGWQTEVAHLNWLWEVWPLLAPPAAGSKADRINRASRKWIKDMPPEHKKHGVGVEFELFRLFNQATRWEAEDYLREHIDGEIKKHFDTAFAVLNQRVSGPGKLNGQDAAIRSELIATAEII